MKNLEWRMRLLSVVDQLAGELTPPPSALPDPPGSRRGRAVAEMLRDLAALRKEVCAHHDPRLRNLFEWTLHLGELQYRLSKLPPRS